MAVKVIDEEEFYKVTTGSKKKVIVDCYADWCGPCRMLGPIVEEVSNENKEYEFYKIKFVIRPYSNYLTPSPLKRSFCRSGTGQGAITDFASSCVLKYRAIWIILCLSSRMQLDRNTDNQIRRMTT